MFAMSPTTDWASFPHVSPICKRAIRSPFWKSTGVSNSLSISKASDYLLGTYKMEAMASNICVSPKCTQYLSPPLSLECLVGHQSQGPQECQGCQGCQRAQCSCFDPRRHGANPGAAVTGVSRPRPTTSSSAQPKGPPTG